MRHELSLGAAPLLDELPELGIVGEEAHRNSVSQLSRRAHGQHGVVPAERAQLQASVLAPPAPSSPIHGTRCSGANDGNVSYRFVRSPLTSIISTSTHRRAPEDRRRVLVRKPGGDTNCGVAPATKKVLADALELSAEERADLAEQILRSLDDDEDVRDPDDRRRLHEAVRRSDEQYASGQGIPAELVLERLSKR